MSSSKREEASHSGIGGHTATRRKRHRRGNGSDWITTPGGSDGGKEEEDNRGAQATKQVHDPSPEDSKQST